MSNKRVKLDLSYAEANSLFGFAIEGETAAEDLVEDGSMHWQTFAAGARATVQLAVAMQGARS